MNRQEDLIKAGGWKYLIVLDACRYDYFKRNCRIPGRLQQAISPACHYKGTVTSNWYRYIFIGEYPDIIHVSGHPRVNSRVPVEGFDAKKHFSKIIDVWDTDWDDSIGTVFPESLTARAIDTIKEYPDKRFIIHYVQPHTPYICLGVPDAKKKKTPASRQSFGFKLKEFTVSRVRCFLGDIEAVNIMRFFRLPALSPMDDALRKVGPQGVKNAYRDNLCRVLKSVEDLIKEANGKVVITSDHAEFLGEYRRFGHNSSMCRHKELIEVPWFEVEQGKS